MGLVIAALVILAIFGFWFMSMYNRLIGLRNQLERAWANIDVILKQRYDEIPQLIQILEQTVQFEAGVIKSLVEARKHYGSAGTINDKIAASQEISTALKGVFAIGEAYPNLKSNDSFIQLQSRISNLESILSDRRELYNESVSIFNSRIEQFPDTLAAGFLNYRRQEMFKIDEVERSKPNLKINMPKFGS
jgi:LemA protein